MLLMSTFYICNLSQQQYLSVSSEGEASLSPTPTCIEMTPVSDGTGLYDVNEKSIKWVLKPTDASRTTFTVGYYVDDAYATGFLYAKGTGNDHLATTYSEPAFEAGLWRISTSIDTEVDHISLSEKVAYSEPTFNHTHAEVVLTRKMAAQKWNSFCVPFPLSQEQIVATWGEGTLVAEFTSFDGNKIYFTTCQSIPAGQPCLLKPAQTTANHQYTLSQIATADWAKGTEPTSVSKGDMDYIGAYTGMNVPARAYVFGGTDKMFHLTAAQDMDGYRAYFVDKSGNNAKQLSWGLDDGSTTGIASANEATAPKPQGIHTIDGKQVSQKATTTQGLAPGIYIMNGMKVIVK